MSYLGKHIASLERDIRALDREIEEACGPLVRERQQLQEALDALLEAENGNGNGIDEIRPEIRLRRSAWQRLSAEEKREVAIEALTEPGAPEWFLAAEWARQRYEFGTREYRYWAGLMAAELKAMAEEGLLERHPDDSHDRGRAKRYRLLTRKKTELRIRPGEGVVE